MLRATIESLKKQLLSTQPVSDGGSLELEAVFYQYPFMTGVHRNTFFRVLNYLESIAESEYVQYQDLYLSGQSSGQDQEIRKTVQVGQQDKYIKKSVLKKVICNEYEFKLTMKSESVVRPVSAVVKTIRNKRRWSFALDSTIVDLSIVESGNKDSLYEIEVESTTGLPDKEFFASIESLLYQIQGTNVVYQIGKYVFNRGLNKGEVVPLEKLRVVNYINSVLVKSDDRAQNERGRGEDYNRRFHNLEIKLVNLKYQHLTWGGLIGNPKIKYRVTLKTDGEHKFMYFGPDGVYLFYFPDQVNKVLSVSSLSPESRKTYNLIVGSILEGEYVSVGNTEYRFVCFDCLGIVHSTRFKDLRGLSHSQRILEANVIIDMWNGLKLKPRIDNKSFFDLELDLDYTRVTDSVQSNNYFIKSVEACLGLKTDYETDGLVFIPNVPYKDSKGLTYKWKPFEKLSIDFLVNVDQSDSREARTIDLLYGDTYNTSFKGSNKFDFNPEQILVDSFSSVTDGQIVEVVPVLLDGVVHLKMYRIRNDKVTPNYKDIVFDVFDDINDNIDSDTLLDRSLKRSRKYQNRVKRELFAGVKDKSVLLDIGTGRGGDLSKWGDFDYVVAVEPDPVNLDLLRGRLHRSEMRDRVEIVETGGEAFRSLSAYKSTVVSSMLSLSFFAGSKLVDLCRTICGSLDIGGEFVFLSINGYAVRKLFSQLNTNVLVLNESTFEFFPEINQLAVKIDRSIVRGQLEYLVDFGLLERVLSDNGFVLEYIKQCSEEKFFGPVESMYNSLYSYGKFRRMKSVGDFIDSNWETNFSKGFVDSFDPTKDFASVDSDTYRGTHYEIYQGYVLIPAPGLYGAVLNACCGLYQESKDSQEDIAKIFEDGLLGSTNMTEIGYTIKRNIKVFQESGTVESKPVVESKSVVETYYTDSGLWIYLFVRGEEYFTMGAYVSGAIKTQFL